MKKTPSEIPTLMLGGSQLPGTQLQEIPHLLFFVDTHTCTLKNEKLKLKSFFKKFLHKAKEYHQSVTKEVIFWLRNHMTLTLEASNPLVICLLPCNFSLGSLRPGNPQSRAWLGENVHSASRSGTFCFPIRNRLGRKSNQP